MSPPPRCPAHDRIHVLEAYAEGAPVEAVSLTSDSSRRGGGPKSLAADGPDVELRILVRT